ncbi:MAG TPA: hypothetical protein VFQ61_23155, partial [Polyangiaceae bacterium]|nr:hypothetical protein [Polyangiaceae bacterium]
MQRLNSIHCAFTVLLLSLSASVGCGEADHGNGGPGSRAGASGVGGGANSGRGGGNSGSGASMSGGGNTGSTTEAPPGFHGTPGSTGFVPLSAGCGPSTRLECSSQCASGAGNSTVLRPPATLCFVSDEDPSPADPIALIEQVIEETEGKRLVHLRVTFDPAFVDNTYGENA